MATPVLRLDPPRGGAAEWQPAPGRGELAEAARRLARRPVVLVPGEAVRVATAAVPARSRRRIRQALPYVLEDSLSVEPEALALAVGRRRRDGQVPALAVDRATAAGWRQRLAGAGLTATRIVPDSLAVPVEPGGWRILFDDGGARVLVRAGPYAAHAVEAELLPALAESLAASWGAPERVVLHVPATVPTATADDLAAALGPALPAACSIQRETGDRDALATLASWDATGLPADLDLGEAVAGGPELAGQLRRWRVPAALALALLGVLAGQSWAELDALAERAQRLEATARQRYNDLLPRAEPLTEPAQLERKLAALRQRAGAGAAPDSFTALLRRAGPVLDNRDGLTVAALRYGGGELGLRGTLADLGQLEGLRAALRDAGVASQVERAASGGDRVRIRLTITPQGGGA